MRKLVARMLAAAAVSALFAFAAPVSTVHAAAIPGVAQNPIQYCRNLAECAFDSCVGQSTPFAASDLTTFPTLPLCQLSKEPNVPVLKGLICGIRSASIYAQCLNHFQKPGPPGR
jgi:hypothetical protein